MDASRWLTVREAAARLRVHEDTVYERIRLRKFTVRREGRRILIEAASLDAYERSTVTPALSVVPAAPVRAREQTRPAADMPWLGFVTGQAPRRGRRS